MVVEDLLGKFCLGLYGVGNILIFFVLVGCKKPLLVVL